MPLFVSQSSSYKPEFRSASLFLFHFLLLQICAVQMLRSGALFCLGSIALTLKPAFFVMCTVSVTLTLHLPFMPSLDESQ